MHQLLHLDVLGMLGAYEVRESFVVKKLTNQVQVTSDRLQWNRNKSKRHTSCLTYHVRSQ